MKISKAIKRALIKRAVKRSLTNRLLKPVPLIGASAVLALAFSAIRKKGAVRGSADVALDLIPVVGLTKGIVEIFTGDLIPDKKDRLKLDSAR